MKSFINSSKIIIGIKDKQYNYFSPGKITISNEYPGYKVQVKSLEHKDVMYIVFGVVTTVLVVAGLILGTGFVRSRRASSDSDE